MSDDSDDEKVGYCRPPKHTRFKPGQSGNPRGRPIKQKSVGEIVGDLFNRKIKIGGQRVPVTQGLILQIVTQGLRGDLKSADLALKLLERHCPPPPPDATVEPSTEEDTAIVAAYISRFLRGGNSDDEED
jgi:hypothetical protein